MSYRMHSRPTFNPSAAYVSTGKLKVFAGVKMSAGTPMPPSPRDPAQRIKYLRDLRQLYELRMVDVAPAPPQKSKKEKA